MDVGLGVTASEQLFGQAGIRGDVLQADGPLRDAVEVGADADVVDPGDLDDVVDMVGDVLDRAARQLGALVRTRLPSPVAGRGVGVFGPECSGDGLALRPPRGR